MNEQVAKAMEVLFYAQCELEGMKATNQYRSRQDLAQAYSEEEFLNLAEETRGRFRDAIEGIYKWK